MGMKKLLAAGLAVAAAAAASLYWKFRKRPAVVDGEVVYDEPEASIEAIFLREWTAALNENARAFNGLFSGLHRVHSGAAKKPEKVLREWCQRTHYRWENGKVDTLCREQIQPLIASGDAAGLTKWANLLLDAASAAGITREEAASLVLTEENVEHYIEWDDGELYPGDTVELLSPAWYQHGKLLEQGQCHKVNEK